MRGYPTGKVEINEVTLRRSTGNNLSELVLSDKSNTHTKDDIKNTPAEVQVTTFEHDKSADTGAGLTSPGGGGSSCQTWETCLSETRGKTERSYLH